MNLFSVNCTFVRGNISCVHMSAYALPGLFPPLPKQYEYTSFSTADFSLFPFERREDSPCAAKADVCTEDRVGISVKDGKIDSALLVQSLAKPDKPATHGNRSRRKTVDSNPRDRKGAVPSQDEAMQFVLSVSFAGQKYTTVRSWPSICQFRKDLIRNLRPCEIPELPSLHPPGVLYRSFSFLQSLVTSYVPTLEGWLRDITALVPHDNPILSHFLYDSESNTTDCGNSVLVEELENRSNSSTRLDAIEESETETEE